MHQLYMVEQALCSKQVSPIDKTTLDEATDAETIIAEIIWSKNAVFHCNSL